MSTYITILTIALSVLLAAAAGVIIWRLAKTKRNPVFVTLFLVLPAGQLLLLRSFLFDTWTAYWLAGVLFGLVADILLLIYTISQEKKIAAQKELSELRHRMALEKAHYDSIEAGREQLEEIRLDFSRRLEAVASLAGSGDGRTGEMIADLSKRINRTQENPYCAIPVVNAILAEKEKTCEEESIGLAVELDIPEPLVVLPMHLCSIFSNILDNAIAACRKLQSAAKPEIRISSRTDGDYLFIKATNPSDKPGAKPAPGRGYGMRILSELAGRYGGNFQSDYSEGTFTAVVSLLAVE